MKVAYLIDADWVIHHLNGHATITQRLQDLQAEGLGLSVVALAEVYEGVFYARDPEASERGLDTFPESVTLVGIDEETAKIFGRERGRLRAAGMIIGDTDLLIGATALQMPAPPPPTRLARQRTEPRERPKAPSAPAP